MFEIGHRLGRQREAVAGRELGDPLPMLLPLPDLRAQPPVDVGDGRGELLLPRLQQFLHPGQRYAGLGQRADPDQLHNRRGIVAPVTGVVPLRLRQQPRRVVVPHGPHRDAGVGRELADREHDSSLPQAILRW